MTRKMIVDAHQVTCDGMVYRCDVYEYLFDKAVEVLEKRLGDATMGGVDAALFGTARFGYTRFGVYYPLFDKVAKELERK